MNTFRGNICGLRISDFLKSLSRQSSVTRSSSEVFSFEDIPAAGSLPIFGTTLFLIAAGSAPQLHKYIDKRHKQLGTIFREKLGSVNAVFIASPNLMRSVFLYEGQYPTHPLPEAWILYNKKKKCRRGLFFMDGEEWLHNRRIMNRLLLTGNCNWMNSLIERSTQKFITQWTQTTSQKKYEFIEISDLENQLYRWSIDVITGLMFGQQFENASRELEETIEIFSQKVHRIFESSSKLMNFPPKIAESLKLKRWMHFEENVDEVLQLGNKIIDMSLAEMSVADGLYTMMKQNNMDTDDIRRIFVDLIIAAGDTTAFSTQWALYILSSNMNIQNKVRSEVNKSPSDHEIPYIRGLIRETLRLYPVAPFIGRFLACDAILGNYKINKNTLVLLSLYTSGRDENNFPNPLAVKPDRWLRNENRELGNVLQAHGTLPFAIGSRSCIGRKIALAQMHSLIRAVVQKFELKCLNEDNVDIILRLVAVPNHNIRLSIKQRNIL